MGKSLLGLSILFVVAGISNAYRIHSNMIPLRRRQLTRSQMWPEISKQLSYFFVPSRPKSNPSTKGNAKVANIVKSEDEIKREQLIVVDASIAANRTLLVNAAVTKTDDPDSVVESLLALEKLMRKRNALDEGLTGANVLANLNGAWRLIFTTGTIDTQKKIGRRVNYFPIKAAQCFDTSCMQVTNGIYLGDFAVLKFFGPFEFNTKSKKLEFDFDEIAVLGLKFKLPKGGAAKIGSSTGLGADSNVENVNKGRKPFFNWISADEDIATARGGGGGLALWKRDKNLEELNRLSVGEAI